MFGFGKRSFNSSMTNIYLFLFILLINQFIVVRSFRLMSNDLENDQDDVRRAVVRQLVFEKLANSDESSDDNDLNLVVKQPLQRRFCCMSPLSGRKRSVRKQIQKRHV